MSLKRLILHVAVPAPLYQTFDYLAPAGCDASQLKPGIRIKIPWRQNQIIGILLAVSETSSVKSTKLKAAIAILDDTPLFSPALLTLIQFAAAYYHYPIGEVFAAALPTLLRQGRETEYRHHDAIFEALPETVPLLTLNIAQQHAVKAILKDINIFKAFLLFGVTGSGKTEVYLQVIAEVLAHQKQALILVPEIGLTPQTVMRFQQRFPVNIAVLHSGLTDRERHNAWLQAKNGDAKIIIGTRSAIFTPLFNPGVIIIDEEHDLSFKQQEGFRYSARDLAIMRAQLEKIPIILGSATPSLESLHNAKLQRYKLIMLPERAGAAVHPNFYIIDMRKQAVKNHLSPLLLTAIQKHLDQKNQVLIFLNRRGYAPTVQCHQCGWVASCKRCDARMTLHQQPSYLLQCHHCGATRPVDKSCADCEATQLFPLGSGTERIEQALQNYFPDIPIIRIDRDTTRLKGQLENKLATIHQGESSILIGTQMLAKGHHFTEVSLAAILNIDSGLYSADFRGAERTAQLITQVAGRAGRVEKPGDVILQTYHPEHPLLKILLDQGYEKFAGAALIEREAAGLPPYQSLALIRAEAIKSDIALDFLTEIKIILQSYESFGKNTIIILGPVSAPMQKRAGKHRAQLLLQAIHRKDLKNNLEQLTQHLNQLKNKQRVRWSIDVDPQEIF